MIGDPTFSEAMQRADDLLCESAAAAGYVGYTVPDVMREEIGRVVILQDEYDAKFGQMENQISSMNDEIIGWDYQVEQLETNFLNLFEDCCCPECSEDIGRDTKIIDGNLICKKCGYGMTVTVY